MKHTSLVLSCMLSLGLSLFSRADIAVTEVARSEELHEQRANPQKSLEALALLERALQVQPENGELRWRASRSAWWAGTLLERKSDRLAAFRRGKAHGAEAVRISSSSVEAHFWLGANYASFGHVNGMLSSLFAIPTVRRTMERVLQLDERYMGAGAYRILGILDYKLPGWAGGNRKRGMERLMKSLELAPKHPVTLFYIADCHWTGGDKKTARQWMERFLDGSTDPSFQLEKQILLQEERRTIEKIGGRTR